MKMPCNSSSSEPALAVIISTTGRQSLIDISIPSVFYQSRTPDILYVVSDSDEVLSVSDIAVLKNANFRVKHIINMREKNLTGAMNTVFSEMLFDGFNPVRTFIAVLDDDDWWESDYLDSCYNAAMQSDSDWVVSGIIRHESKGDSGNYLSIPETLSEKSFLIGNPHIQGSNLFVKFSQVLLAGGYDENLPSTTDRDLCLRLLALGNIKITTLKRHMVHHLAYGEGRLSEVGSEKKCLGLKRFYYKYMPFMDENDRKLFLDRAEIYFGCYPERVPENNTVDR